MNRHTATFETKRDDLSCSCEVGRLSEVLNYLKLSSSSVDAHEGHGVEYSTCGRA